MNPMEAANETTTQRPKRRHRPKAFMRGVLVIAFVMLALCSWAIYRGGSWRLLSYEVITPLQIGAARPGLHIDYVSQRSLVQPSAVAILVRHDGDHFFLKSLDELGGLLQVRNGSDALAFVRLQTRYEFAVPEPREEELGSYRAEPGQHKYIAMDLTPALLAKMGMHEATVRAVGTDFVVDRWIQILDPVRGVVNLQQVSERVTPDGHYQRTVLQTKRPVAHPAVSWGLLGRQ